MANYAYYYYLGELVDLVAHADDVLLPGGQDGDACRLRPLDVPTCMSTRTYMAPSMYMQHAS